AKAQGKLKISSRKTKKRGPCSTSDVRKTKSMEEVLGVEPLAFSEDEESLNLDVPPDSEEAALCDDFPAPLTPKSSLKSIIQQEDIRADFSMFMAANKRCSEEVNREWIVKGTKKNMEDGKAGKEKQGVMTKSHDEFQPVTNGVKVKSVDKPSSTTVNNSFQMLAECVADMNVGDTAHWESVAEGDDTRGGGDPPLHNG
uniref:Uncharacterized protein n=1 Tax=Cannabis sativa TaxID=3483 RepID=A0A803QSI7_CANSA